MSLLFGFANACINSSELFPVPASCHFGETYSLEEAMHLGQFSSPNATFSPSSDDPTLLPSLFPTSSCIETVIENPLSTAESHGCGPVLSNASCPITPFNSCVQRAVIPAKVRSSLDLFDEIVDEVGLPTENATEPEFDTTKTSPESVRAVDFEVGCSPADRNYVRVENVAPNFVSGSSNSVIKSDAHSDRTPSEPLPKVFLDISIFRKDDCELSSLTGDESRSYLQIESDITGAFRLGCFMRGWNSRFLFLSFYFLNFPAVKKILSWFDFLHFPLLFLGVMIADTVVRVILSVIPMNC